METGDYVDGEGVISDESDFYGSEQMRKKLEKQARRSPKRAANSAASPPPKKVKLENDTPKSKASHRKPEDVLDFLKSRPQLAHMQQSSQKVSFTQPLASQYEEIALNAGFIANRSFEGDLSAWQQSETVVDFLRRRPVSDPATASIGPWLWVGNPRYPVHWKRQEDMFDKSIFCEIAGTMLSDFEDRRERIKEENPGKAPAGITKKLNPYCDALEKDLLAKAKEHHVTSGKWMLFPGPDELPRSWRIVAEATAAGKLGPTSKVGTWEPGSEKKGTLICVYTYDFTDQEDVKRVLSKMLELELFRPGGKQVYYKCDAYTYLNIGSQNAYNLKASIYASGKVLEDVPAAQTGAGPKKNGTMDRFVSQGKWEF